MPRRAGKRRTEKRALIARIKEAKKKDEETRRTAPRIIEKQILLDLPPLLRVKPSEERRLKRKGSSSEDSLHLFPEELDRDLNWSPDEFDREYFRLWEEENNERWEKKRERKNRRQRELFGEDSETEKEKKEIEESKRAREERERKEEEFRLFGIISESEEEEKEIELDREEEKMEIEMERGEERMEIGREDEEMSWEEEDDDVIIVEEENRVQRIEKEIEGEIKRRVEEERKGGTGASRAIVPRRVKGYWLKARSRLDLSVPLPIKRKL